jgi:hypothetical protein
MKHRHLYEWLKKLVGATNMSNILLKHKWIKSGTLFKYYNYCATCDTTLTTLSLIVFTRFLCKVSHISGLAGLLHYERKRLGTSKSQKATYLLLLDPKTKCMTDKLRPTDYSTLEDDDISLLIFNNLTPNPTTTHLSSPTQRRTNIQIVSPSARTTSMNEKYIDAVLEQIRTTKVQTGSPLGPQTTSTCQRNMHTLPEQISITTITVQKDVDPLIILANVATSFPSSSSQQMHTISHTTSNITQHKQPSTSSLSPASTSSLSPPLPLSPLSTSYSQIVTIIPYLNFKSSPRLNPFTSQEIQVCHTTTIRENQMDNFS